jgi:predicted RNase H-like HicB family nuclease
MYTNIHIKGNITIDVYDDGYGYVIAECGEFGIEGWGQTEEQALATLHERQQLLFEELLEKNEINTFLEQRGWNVEKIGEGEKGSHLLLTKPIVKRVKSLAINEYFENVNSPDLINA